VDYSFDKKGFNQLGKQGRLAGIKEVKGKSKKNKEAIKTHVVKVHYFEKLREYSESKRKPES